MLITGIGYCTLHSSCGTYSAIEQDTLYPSEGISLYKCYLGRAFQFLEVLTALWWPTGPNLEYPQPPDPLFPGLGGQEEAVLSHSLPVHFQVHLWHPSSPSCHSSRARSKQDAEFLYRQQNWQLRRWRRRRRRLVPFEGFIPRSIKRCWSNSTREDSRTASAGKCWCSELYKQDELSVLSKTSLSCAKVLRRVGGVGVVKPIGWSCSFKRLWSSFKRRWQRHYFFTRNGKLEQQVIIWWSSFPSHPIDGWSVTEQTLQQACHKDK